MREFVGLNKVRAVVGRIVDQLEKAQLSISRVSRFKGGNLFDNVICGW